MLKKKTVSQCVSADWCRGWNAAVSKMPKWISVDELLPDKSGMYLTISPSGIQTVLDYSYRHKAFNAFDLLPECRNALTVTHWMPLPPAPKEG